jgi:hypothetical protein
MPKFFCGTNKISLVLFLATFGFFFFPRTMSASSSYRRVHQMTEEGIATTRARIENRQAIPKRNVVRANVMVAPLDIIADIIHVSL